MPYTDINPALLTPRPGVSTAIFKDGLVLLGQRSKPPLRGVWSLPGGHIEAGETKAEAAARELLEETGVIAELHGIADVVDVILRNDDGALRAHYILTVFYGDWRSGDPSPADDCTGVQWANPHALGSLNLTEGTADIIHRALRLLDEKNGTG